MNVETIMTKQPVCCSPSDTVQHVAQMMRQNDIGALPVVSDLVSKNLVGIITDRDLCISAMADGKDPRATPIANYFTKTVVTCTPEDALEVCEQKMKQHRVRRMPVVDKKNECVGMVVQADLARVDKADSFLEMVAEISRPNTKRVVPLAVA
jgi:CBS domain-containing protein